MWISPGSFLEEYVLYPLRMLLVIVEVFLGGGEDENMYNLMNSLYHMIMLVSLLFCRNSLMKRK